mmetsp:Transcript_130286/g.405291  ORF Transcript_130286/g.405291 Transcript_130286/m.405291 type:complete len:126 (-) Transcript_130286:1079-1456(-)
MAPAPLAEGSGVTSPSPTASGESCPASPMAARVGWLAGRSSARRSLLGPRALAGGGSEAADASSCVTGVGGYPGGGLRLLGALLGLAAMLLQLLRNERTVLGLAAALLQLVRNGRIVLGLAALLL